MWFAAIRHGVRPCERMRALLRSLKSSLEESMRQQVTARGVFFTCMTLLVGLAAFVSANNLLFLLLAAMLATLLLSGFISRLGLAGLELKVDLPEHIAARRAVIGRLKIRNSKLFTPSFSLTFSGAPDSGMAGELYIPVVPARSALEEPVRLEFARRGLYRDNVFFFATEFPFGFTRRRARVHLEREVLVYPPIDPAPSVDRLAREIAGELDARARGAGHDFYRIRPYDAFESARHVDWKATAHTGDLQVREYTRDDEQNLTVFLDLEPTRDEGAFERFVAGAAHFIWRFSSAGSQVRLMSQQFDLQCPQETSAYTILKYLALASPVRSLTPPHPHADGSVQIVFSARRDIMVRAGWHAARFAGAGVFARSAE